MKMNKELVNIIGALKENDFKNMFKNVTCLNGLTYLDSLNGDLFNYLIKTFKAKKINSKQKSFEYDEWNEYKYEVNIYQKTFCFWEEEFNSSDIYDLLEEKFKEIYLEKYNFIIKAENALNDKEEHNISIVNNFYNSLYGKNVDGYYIRKKLEDGYEFNLKTLPDDINLEEIIGNSCMFANEKKLIYFITQLINNKDYLLDRFTKKENCSNSTLLELINRAVQMEIEDELIQQLVHLYKEKLIVKEVKFFNFKKRYGFTKDNLFIHQKKFTNIFNIRNVVSGSEIIIKEIIDDPKINKKGALLFGIVALN